MILNQDLLVSYHRLLRMSSWIRFVILLVEFTITSSVMMIMSFVDDE